MRASEVIAELERLIRDCEHDFKCVDQYGLPIVTVANTRSEYDNNTITISS